MSKSAINNCQFFQANATNIVDGKIINGTVTQNDRKAHLFSALTREIVFSNLIIVVFMGLDVQEFQCSIVGAGFKPAPTCVRPNRRGNKEKRFEWCRARANTRFAPTLVI